MLGGAKSCVGWIPESTVTSILLTTVLASVTRLKLRKRLEVSMQAGMCVYECRYDVNFCRLRSCLPALLRKSGRCRPELALKAKSLPWRLGLRAAV